MSKSHLFPGAADVLSTMAVAYSIVPFFVFVVCHNFQHACWGFAVLAAPFVAELLKRGTQLAGMLDTQDWPRRPRAASNCDIWNTNGPQGGAPGFPSGHTATAAAFWMGAWLLTRSQAVAVVGGAAVVAMAWARLQKQCHTMLQVVGGGMLGASVSVLFLKG